MIPLKVSVNPEHWDSKSQVVTKGPGKDSINLMIEEKRLAAMRILEQLRQEDRLTDMSLVDVKNYIAAVLYPEHAPKSNEPEHPFIAHYRRFMGRKKGGTYSVYHQTLVKLEKYDPDIASLGFEDITVQWLRDFDEHMSQTMSVNARSIHFRNIRAVFNDALDEELITCYPFRKFKIKSEETRKRALPVEDLRKLFTMEVEPYAEIYRDMFKLIFMLIGINAVDLYGLESISHDGRVEYRRAKTHKLYSIKLEPEARELIDKWKGKEHLLMIPERWSDHRNFLHQMNKALSLIGAPIGKQGKKGDGLFPGLSTYWARHSWATIARKLGVGKDVIAQALGHGSKTVTDIYIDEDMELVDEANRRVLDWVLYGKK